MIFEPHPDSSHAHDWLLNELRTTLKATFVSEPINMATFGNLGEAIAYLVGYQNDFTDALAFTANAFDPMARISRPSIDILWINLGESPEHDWIAIQEVKTTSRHSLSIANDLNTDYEKLFGSDPRLTFQTRMNAVEIQLRLQRREDALADRIVTVTENAVSPVTSHRVTLVPTLVHESESGDAVVKLLAVRTSLFSLGWQARSILPWSIRLDNLEARIRQLARGEN